MVPSRESRGPDQQRERPPSLESMPLPVSTSSSQSDPHNDMEDGSDDDLDCSETMSVRKPHLQDCEGGIGFHRKYCHNICLCCCWACEYYRYEQKCIKDKVTELVVLTRRILNQTKTTL